MALVVNNNLMANNTARYLSENYARLASSTRRLSSGLRINTAADDAAGLAIRELQRADIATLHQGTRNANDAISMIQVADGALQVIDEKLIRMRELAEQAATGTYDSTQRTIINSEFQAMASEIDRIAYATDFNGISLLDGSLHGEHDGTAMETRGAMKVHFGTGNDSDEDYYYVDIDNTTVASLFRPVDWPGGRVENGRYILEIEGKEAQDWMTGLDTYTLPSGITNLKIRSRNTDNVGAHKPHVNLFASDGTQLTGVHVNDTTEHNTQWWNGFPPQTIVSGPGFAPNAQYNGDKIITQAGQSVTHGDLTVNVTASQDETKGQWEEIVVDEVTDDLVFLIGGHQTGHCNRYDLEVSFDIPRPSIETQAKAQQTIDQIETAIVRKDNIRAHLGAMENRLESTIDNLGIQAENLQASESRISDVNVATEMSEFVRNQVLSNSAVSMLSQANTLPQMVMQLLG